MDYSLTTGDKKLDRVIRQYEAFHTGTESARRQAETDRQYVDHVQWTDEELAVLRDRKQPAVVINRIRRKVNMLAGIQKHRRRKVKALPRNPNDEGAADAATEALRFVSDNNDFDQLSSQGFEDMVVWGYGAGIVEYDEANEMCMVRRIAPDRFYYDPHSRERDFSDSKYFGIVVWMDAKDARRIFPGSSDHINSYISAGDIGGDTFEDRPVWVDSARERVRVCQHYFIDDDGSWKVCYFMGNAFLQDPEDAPLQHDRTGTPICPIVAQSCYVDIDNNRYGEVRGDRWVQDEINHRRSRLLYNTMVRQTVTEEGAINDVQAMKRELARPDGNVTINPGMRFEVLPNEEANQIQFQLYQESKAEIDAAGTFGMMAAAGAEAPELSGRALQTMQQGAISELIGLYDAWLSWEKRVFRRVWMCIRQHWTAEKWIRITDDEQKLKWVGLNRPKTVGEALAELAQQGDQEAAQQLETLSPESLSQIWEIENEVRELGVDIIIDSAPDYASLRQEQFDKLAELAGAYGPEAVPFAVMLKLSDLPNKEQIEQLLNPEGAEQAKAQQQQMQMQLAQAQLEGVMLENEKTKAEVEKLKAEAAAKLADAGKAQAETGAIGTPDSETVVVV